MCGFRMKVAVGINYIGCANCCGLFMSKDGFKGHIELCDGDPLKSPCEAFACSRQKYLEFIAKDTLMHLKDGTDNYSIGDVEKTISPKRNKNQKRKDNKKSNSKLPLVACSLNNAMPESSHEMTLIPRTYEESTSNPDETLLHDSPNRASTHNVAGAFDLNLSSDEENDNKSKISIPLQSKMLKDVELSIVTCNNQIVPKDHNTGLLTTALDPPLSSCYSSSLLNDQQFSPGGWPHSLQGPASLSKDTLHDSNSAPSLEPYGVPVSETILQQDLTVNDMNVQSAEVDKKTDQSHLSENEPLMIQVDNFPDSSSQTEKEFHSEFGGEKDNVGSDDVPEASPCNGRFGYGLDMKTVKTDTVPKTVIETLQGSNAGDINKLISQLEQSIKSSGGSEQTTELISACKTPTLITVKSPSTDSNHRSEKVREAIVIFDNDKCSSGDELVIDESPKIIRYRHRSRRRRNHRASRSHRRSDQRESPSFADDVCPQKSKYKAYFDYCGSQKSRGHAEVQNTCVFVNDISLTGSSTYNNDCKAPTKSVNNVQTVVVYPPGTPILTYNLVSDQNTEDLNSDDPLILNLKPCTERFEVGDTHQPSIIYSKQFAENVQNGYKIHGTSVGCDGNLKERSIHEQLVNSKPSDGNHEDGLAQIRYVPVKPDKDAAAQTDVIIIDGDEETTDEEASVVDDEIEAENLEQLDISKLVDKLAPVPRYKTSTRMSVRRSKANTKKVKQVYIDKILTKSAEDNSDKQYCQIQINGLPVLKRITKLCGNNTDSKVEEPEVKKIKMYDKGSKTKDSVVYEFLDPISKVGTSDIPTESMQSEVKSNPLETLKASSIPVNSSPQCEPRGIRKTGVRRSLRTFQCPKSGFEYRKSYSKRKDEILQRDTCKSNQSKALCQEVERTSPDVKFQTKSTKDLAKDSSRKYHQVDMPSEDQYMTEMAKGRVVYICKLCQQKLLSLVKLRNHLTVTHNNGGVFSCDHCNFTTPYRRRWKAHVKRHTKDKNICPYCPTFYVDNSSLNRHINMKHFEQSNYRCSECGFIAMDNPLLADHMRTHTGELLVCSFEGCDFKTPSLRAHREHERGHEPDFLCVTCGYSTSNKQTFNGHLLTHQSIKAYQCSLCPHRAKTKQHILRHASSVHFDVQTYACDRCSFKTSYQAALTCHVLSHEGLRPFKCSICDYQTNSTSLVYRHGRTAHTNQTVTAVKVVDNIPVIKGSDYLNPHTKPFDPRLFEILEVDNLSLNKSRNEMDKNHKK
ncbi:uncharacterized protein LOC126818346 [Patella vulgata]|uniref:uncharacterized protein LOC126818346 n=1 Tax=Patella vulgata TaxID=6465 RepID=UPI00217F6B4B|nr:uncharacterized protein LOC126818346 [Patella vulgata]